MRNAPRQSNGVLVPKCSTESAFVFVRNVAARIRDPIGFQAFFERQRLRFARKGKGGFDSPGSEFRRVGTVTSVVLPKALGQVMRETSVMMVRLTFTNKNRDVRKAGHSVEGDVILNLLQS